MTDSIREEMVALLPRLRRFAYSLSGTLDDADDLVQASCERALARLDQFRPGTRLDSWMFRIIQTVWIDRMRAHSKRSMIIDDGIVNMIPHDARIHEQTEARGALDLIRKEIHVLTEDQRLVISLVAVDGMSYQEAADVLDVPVGTVMSRLARARKKLASLLDANPTDRVMRARLT